MPTHSELRRQRVHRVAVTVAMIFVAAAAACFAGSAFVAARSIAGSAEGDRASLWTTIGLAVMTDLVLVAIVVRLSQRSEAAALRAAQTEDQLLDAGGLVVAGSLAAGAAHDFRNLLMVVGGTAEALQLVPGLPERARPMVSDLLEATQRGVEIAQQLAESGRRFNPTVRTRASLRALVRRSIGLARAHPQIRRFTIDLASGDDVEADVYAPLLSQAIINLVLNAAQARPDGRAVASVELAGGEIVMALDDDGPGVPIEIERRLFDAPVTTKDAGTGLGLISVRVCAQYHGGRVAHRRSDLGGARFEIRIPAQALAAA